MFVINSLSTCIFDAEKAGAKASSGLYESMPHIMTNETIAKGMTDFT